MTWFTLAALVAAFLAGWWVRGWLDDAQIDDQGELTRRE